jgi:hypothetical protein
MTFMAENSRYHLTIGMDNVPRAAGNAMICRRDGYGGLIAQGTPRNPGFRPGGEQT